MLLVETYIFKMIIPGKLLLLCNVAFYFLCFALKYSFSEINVAMLLFLLFTVYFPFFCSAFYLSHLSLPRFSVNQYLVFHFISSIGF